MLDKLENSVNRLLRKHNMNDCWECKSENDIKIYFSENEESNRRFLFSAKLEANGMVSCEFSLDELEYAKDKVWEQSFHTLDNQIYIFGKQLHRLWRLKDQVDIVITDSPLLFSIIYDKTCNEKFRALVLDQFNQFKNINYFITRGNTYNPKGRMQTLEESMDLDCKIASLLEGNSIPFSFVNKVDAIDIICENTLKFDL